MKIRTTMKYSFELDEPIQVRKVNTFSKTDSADMYEGFVDKQVDDSLNLFSRCILFEKVELTKFEKFISLFI